MAFPKLPLRRSLLAALSAVVLCSAAFGDEAAIRKNLTERYPDYAKIDEVSKTPMAGLYEVRIGMDVYYTDERGNYLLQGELIDTKSHANLTEQRVAKLTAIDFAALPLKDAIVWKRGTGARKLVVFADPNCGYCKKLERDLQQVKDVTVYTFLYPILGGDSPEKSRNIWCAKDNTKAWRDWMLEGTAPTKVMGACDADALKRNYEFGRKYKVNGTPAMVFEDGRRVPGAMPAEEVEKVFAAMSARKPG